MPGLPDGTLRVVNQPAPPGRLVRPGLPALPPVPGRLAFVVVFALSAILAAGALPLISLEMARDWRTYEAAAHHLQAGLSPSFARGELVNLYPPAMALIWTLGLTGMAWFGLILLACGALGVLGRGIERPAIVLLALLQVPVHYDLLMGNVMTMYAAALAWTLVARGWKSAIPLGALLAIAVKPAILPFLVVLLVVRRSDALRVAAVVAVAWLAVLLVVGVGPYVEYAKALLAGPGYLAAWTTGNLGLGRVGPWPAALGVIGGVGVTLLAIRRLPPEMAFAVALGASTLVQPTLGLYYGTLLIPALALLWRVDRLGALVAAVAAIVATVVVSPVPGGLVVIGFAFAAPFERTVVAPAREWLARYHPVSAAQRPPAPPEPGLETQPLHVD